MAQLLKYINENTNGTFEEVKDRLTSKDIKLIVKLDKYTKENNERNYNKNLIKNL